jgi:hypothetical protein
MNLVFSDKGLPSFNHARHSCLPGWQAGENMDLDVFPIINLVIPDFLACS